MKSKSIIITLFVFLFLFPLYSQDYYWYNGNKLKLVIDSTKINITTKYETDLSKLLQKTNSKLELRQIETTKDNTSLFSIEFPSSKEYKEAVNSLKLNSDIASISPYFRRNDNNSIGTSSHFYIKLNKNNDYETLKQFASKMNLEIVKQVPYMPEWYILTTTDNKINSVEASNIAYESGLFTDVDPAFMFDFKVNCTNDPDFSDLWGLNNTLNPNIDINACDAWTITRGSGINVAVVDQGIDPNHNDLKANFYSLSFDARSGTSPSVFTGYSHGTHVAGTVAAIGNNNLQVVGVAPESKIMRVSHALLPSNTGSAELASGISWAWQNGADVINNSWGDQGGQFYSQIHSAVLENAIVNAMTQGRNGKGCVVVFASGNWGLSNRLDYPGSFHNDILTVGSINWNGIRYSSSNYGDKLDVVAPGVGILSTVPNNRVATDIGTSMAAPHVSAIAALILSVNPNLTAKQVRDIIEQTAQKVGGYTYANTTAHPNGPWHEQMGYGLVNAYEAVKRAACMANPVNYISLTGIQPSYKQVICNEINIQNATVPAGSTLILDACNKTTINPGFKVDAGAHFIVR